MQMSAQSDCDLRALVTQAVRQLQHLCLQMLLVLLPPLTVKTAGQSECTFAPALLLQSVCPLAMIKMLLLHHMRSA